MHEKAGSISKEDGFEERCAQLRLNLFKPKNLKFCLYRNFDEILVNMETLLINAEQKKVEHDLYIANAISQKVVL